jgi:hypothetical protein
MTAPQITNTKLADTVRDDSEASYWLGTEINPIEIPTDPVNSEKKRAGLYRIWSSLIHCIFHRDPAPFSREIITH